MSLQVWLTGNNSMNNQGLLGELTQTTVPTYVDGKLGKAMSTGAYKMTAKQTAQVLNNEAISICFWVYINADTGTTDNKVMFFGNEGMGSNNNRKFSLFNYPTVNDFHWSWMNNTGNNIFTTGVLSGVLPSYKWTHVAITYQNPNGTVYINGEKVTTFTGVSNSSTFAYKTQVIHNSTYLRWNDYRIYDHCLSAKEVKEISKGLVAHYKLSGVGGENLLINSGNYTLDTPLTVSSNAKDGWNQSINLYAALESGTTYTLSAKQDGTWSSSHNTGGVDYTKKYNSLWLYLKDGTSYNFLNMTNGYANFTPTKSGTYYIRTNTYSDGTNKVTVNYWDIKLEKGSKATPWCPNPSDTLYSTLGYNDGIEYDCSGYGNNGTKVGNIAWNGDSARYNGSYDFNGTGYVKNSSFNINTTQMTISFWVKISQTITSQHFLFGTFNSWTGNGIGYWRDVGKNYYSGILKSSAESSYVISLSTPSLTANTWYHIAIVYTGTECILYVNGVENKRVTYGKNGIIINPVCYLGNSLYNNTPSSETDESSMSDFRIYTTALSADDIKSLYNVSASIDRTGILSCYEFSEKEE